MPRRVGVMWNVDEPEGEESKVEEVEAADHRPVHQKFQEQWVNEMVKSCDPTKKDPTSIPNDPKSIVEDWYVKICEVTMHKYVEKTALPARAENKLTQRMVSQRTKDLIKSKKHLRKDKKTFKQLKAKIRESCLKPKTL